MSVFTKDSLIPLMSLSAGVLMATTFFAWRQQPSPEFFAAVAQFNALTEGEQTNVRNIAGSYLNDPKYKERIETIHAAVQQDPALLVKLDELDGLLRNQDRATRAKLQPDGKFADNWRQQVEELNRQNIFTEPMVKLWMPWMSTVERGPAIELVPEEKVDIFLDTLVPDPVPEELQVKLNDLNKTTHATERTLVKIIWLVRQQQPETKSGVDAQRVNDAASQYLVGSKIIQKMEEQISRWRSEFGNDNRDVNRSIASLLTRSLLRHYKDRFNRIHVPANSDPAEIFSSELDRQRQLQLMRMDPADAKSHLDSEIIQNLHVSDPAIEALNQDLKDLESQIPRGLEMGGRGRGFGGGSRSGFPRRPSQGGSRQGDDDRGRGPQRERLPGGDPDRPPPNGDRRQGGADRS